MYVARSFTNEKREKIVVVDNITSNCKRATRRSMKSIVVLKPILAYLLVVMHHAERVNGLALEQFGRQQQQSKKVLNSIRLQQNLKGKNIWYIDAYNVLGHSGTPNNVTTLTNALQQILPRTNTVIVVLDGPKMLQQQQQQEQQSDSDPSVSSSVSTTTTTTTTTTIEVANNGSFQKVVLGTGLLADDYIIDQIRAMQGDSRSTTTMMTTSTLETIPVSPDNSFEPIVPGSSINGSRNIVQVVTADRKLRQRILNIKPMKVRGVINPVTFWKRYLPRLCGMKQVASSMTTTTTIPIVSTATSSIVPE
jgi:hypothetical protein